MKIGILAVQGAFIEHKKRLEELGAECFEIRNKSDLIHEFDGLVLPGGESTVQGKLLKELELFDQLQERIKSGLPVLATCAGLILLAENLKNDTVRHFATLPVTVVRNAFGRQLGSFYIEQEFGTLGKVPMTFIRAPVIETVGKNVEILSVVCDSENAKENNKKIVAVRFKNQLAMSFHPELNSDNKIYEYFLDMLE
ncbi:MAG: pyridoxal 5'-phosphate synthase glutaminase subunit PdxT [Spirochaetia bacterium]|nr:pyridoxal 5'-phosphate synthase glutaminase subunit PdxT [Spirochaetia bacterium]